MENVSFEFSASDLPAVLTIILSIIGYNTYWFLAISSRRKAKFESQYDQEEASIRLVQFQKYVGAFFLGVVPLVICLLVLPYSLSDYGISVKNTGASMLWIFGLSALIFPINLNAGKREENLQIYPMMRVQEWSSRLILINSVSTMSYLFAYELLFRGLLLFTCVDVFGVWPAVAINVALYSAVHLPKGAAETIGSLPFGLLLCYITLTTGTIWVSVVVHWVLSLSNDYLAVHHHKDMHFK
jgi:membrane protease YdiL (CAAX protease family)